MDFRYLVELFFTKVISHFNIICYTLLFLKKQSMWYCLNSVLIRSFSGLYFSALGLNTEYSVSLRIQSECGKVLTRKTPNFDNWISRPKFSEIFPLSDAYLELIPTSTNELFCWEKLHGRCSTGFCIRVGFLILIFYVFNSNSILLIQSSILHLKFNPLMPGVNIRSCV